MSWPPTRSSMPFPATASAACMSRSPRAATSSSSWLPSTALAAPSQRKLGHQARPIKAQLEDSVRRQEAKPGLSRVCQWPSGLRREPCGCVCHHELPPGIRLHIRSAPGADGYALQAPGILREELPRVNSAGRSNPFRLASTSLTLHEVLASRFSSSYEMFQSRKVTP